VIGPSRTSASGLTKVMILPRLCRFFFFSATFRGRLTDGISEVAYWKVLEGPGPPRVSRSERPPRAAQGWMYG